MGKRVVDLLYRSCLAHYQGQASALLGALLGVLVARAANSPADTSTPPFGMSFGSASSGRDASR